MISCFRITKSLVFRHESAIKNSVRHSLNSSKKESQVLCPRWVRVMISNLEDEGSASAWAALLLIQTYFRNRITGWSDFFLLLGNIYTLCFQASYSQIMQVTQPETPGLISLVDWDLHEFPSPSHHSECSLAKCVWAKRTVTVNLDSKIIVTSLQIKYVLDPAVEKKSMCAWTLCLVRTFFLKPYYDDHDTLQGFTGKLTGKQCVRFNCI